MKQLKTIVFHIGILCGMMIHSDDGSYSTTPAIASVIAHPSIHIASNHDNVWHSYDIYLHDIKKSMQSVTIEKISFPVQKDDHSQDTFTRHGYLVRRENALGTVIICHGYTQSKAQSFFFRALFSHFNVVAFDFRAHGEMIDGQHSTIGKNELHDVFGAVQFVKNNALIADKPIIGLGFSMGAVALLLAQAKYGNLFDALILDSPFDSSSGCMERRIDDLITSRFLPAVVKRWILSIIMTSLYCPYLEGIVKPLFKCATGLDPYLVPTKFVPVIPLEVVSKIYIPCMFILCQGDQQVIDACVSRLYNAVHSSFKRLWFTQGTGHCLSCLAQPDLYFYKVNKFINKALSGRWKVAAKVIDDR